MTAPLTTLRRRCASPAGTPPPPRQYTINGKKVEVAVKRIISGEHVVATGTLANPASLDLYRNLPRLQQP